MHINAPLSFGEVEFTAPIAELQERHPSITVDLHLNDRKVDIVKEGFDLAVRIGELRDNALIATRLVPCRLVLCACPDYLDRRGRPEALLPDGSPRLLGVYAAFPEARLLPRKVRLFIDHLKTRFGPCDFQDTRVGRLGMARRDRHGHP